MKKLDVFSVVILFIAYWILVNRNPNPTDVNDNTKFSVAFIIAFLFSSFSHNLKVSNVKDENVVNDLHAPTPRNSVMLLSSPENVINPRKKLPIELTAKLETGNLLSLDISVISYLNRAPNTPLVPTR